MRTKTYSRLATRHTARLVLVAFSASILGGGAIPSKAQQISDCESTRQQLCRRIENAIFYKPADTYGLLPIELAPLIVQGIQGNRGDQSYDSLVSIFKDSSGQLAFEREPPTVYFAKNVVSIEGRDFTEYAFVMYFRKLSDTSDGFVSNRLVVVLGSDDFPIMAIPYNWAIEMRHVIRGRRMFVSEELEDLARSRFGPPLSSRCFSIEQENPNRSSTRVAGTFTTGPIPMGLYTYLGPSGGIWSVRCRCSPSLMDNIVETREYRLLPIEDLPEQGITSLSESWTSGVVRNSLRWPFDPPKDAKPDEDR